MAIGEKDCAIIIKEDLEIELVIPSPNGDEDEPSPDNAIMIAALAMAINDKTIMGMLFERMDRLIEEYADDKIPGAE